MTVVLTVVVCELVAELVTVVVAELVIDVVGVVIWQPANTPVWYSLMMPFKESLASEQSASSWKNESKKQPMSSSSPFGPLNSLIIELTAAAVPSQVPPLASLKTKKLIPPSVVHPTRPSEKSHASSTLFKYLASSSQFPPPIKFVLYFSTHSNPPTNAVEVGVVVVVGDVVTVVVVVSEEVAVVVVVSDVVTEEVPVLVGLLVAVLVCVVVVSVVVIVDVAVDVTDDVTVLVAVVVVSSNSTALQSEPPTSNTKFPSST